MRFISLCLLWNMLPLILQSSPPSLEIPTTESYDSIYSLSLFLGLFSHHREFFLPGKQDDHA